MFKNTIWSIISNYKSRSLFVRNFFLILFLVITPLVVMSLVVYQKMDQTAEEEIMLQNLNSVNRVEETIHNIIKDTNRLATQLSLQDNVKFFLYTNYISEEITVKSTNLSEYKVAISERPTNTVAIDKNGETKTTFSSNVTFRIKVPVSQVKASKVTIKISIRYAIILFKLVSISHRSFQIFVII